MSGTRATHLGPDAVDEARRAVRPPPRPRRPGRRGRPLRPRSRRPRGTPGRVRPRGSSPGSGRPPARARPDGEDADARRAAPLVGRRREDRPALGERRGATDRLRRVDEQRARRRRAQAAAAAATGCRVPTSWLADWRRPRRRPGRGPRRPRRRGRRGRPRPPRRAGVRPPPARWWSAAASTAECSTAERHQDVAGPRRGRTATPRTPRWTACVPGGGEGDLVRAAAEVLGDGLAGPVGQDPGASGGAVPAGRIDPQGRVRSGLRRHRPRPRRAGSPGRCGRPRGAAPRRPRRGSRRARRRARERSRQERRRSAARTPLPTAHRDLRCATVGEKSTASVPSPGER